MRLFSWHQLRGGRPSLFVKILFSMSLQITFPCLLWWAGQIHLEVQHIFQCLHHLQPLATWCHPRRRRKQYSSESYCCYWSSAAWHCLKTKSDSNRRDCWCSGCHRSRSGSWKGASTPPPSTSAVGPLAILFRAWVGNCCPSRPHLRSCHHLAQ